MKNKIPPPQNGYAYTFDDVKKIINNFPKGYKWTSQGLSDYLPQDLLVKVEVISNQIFFFLVRPQNIKKFC